MLTLAGPTSAVIPGTGYITPGKGERLSPVYALRESVCGHELSMNRYEVHRIQKLRKRSRFWNFWLPLPPGVRVVLVCMALVAALVLIGFVV